MRRVATTYLLMMVLTIATELIAAQAASAQAGAAPGPHTTYLHCGALIDGRSNEARKNVTVVIKGNRIEAVREGLVPATEAHVPVFDLTRMTCLPGLIDTHTHVLLQGDIIVDYDEQLLKESTAYRAIRAVRAVRLALEHGFTALRDLETEGSGYTDVDLKKAINQGIVPGPRMEVATRALDVTGAYALLGYNWELEMPHGVQVCDGADGCRKAVREQVSHGADWVKVYADQRTWIDHPTTPKTGAGGDPGSRTL